MTAHLGSRVCDSSRANISGVGLDADYTLVSGDAGLFILASSVEDGGSEFRTGQSHSLQWRVLPSGTFATLALTNATGPHLDNATGTITNGTNVATGNRRGTQADGPNSDGFVASGKEFTSSTSQNYGAEVKDAQTEAQWAIDMGNCPASTAYQFQSSWGSKNDGTATFTLMTVTTAAAGGTTHSLAHTTGSIAPTHTSSVTVTSTHSLSHTAGAITTSTSASSITAVQTHDLVHTAGSIDLTQDTADITSKTIHNLSSTATNRYLMADHPLPAGGFYSHITITSGATTHSLAHTTGSIAPTHDSTLKLTHSLTHTTDTIATTHDSTLKLTRSLTHTAGSIGITQGTADITADQTHELAHTAGSIDITQDTADITAARIHSLAHTAGSIATTHDSTLKLTHSLTHTAGSIAPTHTADITAVQTHDLAHTADSIDLTQDTAAITADQTHDLVHTADSIDLTQDTADITSTGSTIRSLAHTTGSVEPTQDTAALTVTSTHNLAHTAGTITPTHDSTLKLTRSLVHTTDSIAPTHDSTLKLTHNLAVRFIFGVPFDSAISIGTVPTAALTVTSTHNLVHTVGSIRITQNTAAALVLTIHRLAHTAGLIAPTQTAALTVTSTHNLAHTAGTIQVTQDTAALTVTSTHNLSATDSIELTHDAAVVLIHSLVHTTDSLTVTDDSRVQAKVVISLQGTGTVSDPTDVSRIESATYLISVTIDGVGDLTHNLLKRSEIMSLEEIWNTGLTQLGVGTVDSAVSDQTAQAILLRKVWDNFRKQFVSDHAWNGCKTTAALTALANSDFKDTTRWGNVFSLPSDYLRALTVNGHPNQAGNAERIMWEIEIVSDSSGAKSRCICTNQSTVKLEYVFDPGDANIGTFLAPAMKHALGLAFAAFVAPNFGKSANDITLIEQKAREALLKARGIDGQESSGIFFGPSELVESRYRSSS